MYEHLFAFHVGIPLPLQQPQPVVHGRLRRFCHLLVRFGAWERVCASGCRRRCWASATRCASAPRCCSRRTGHDVHLLPVLTQALHRADSPLDRPARVATGRTISRRDTPARPAAVGVRSARRGGGHGAASSCRPCGRGRILALPSGSGLLRQGTQARAVEQVSPVGSPIVVYSARRGPATVSTPGLLR